MFADVDFFFLLLVSESELEEGLRLEEADLEELFERLCLERTWSGSR